MKATDKKTLKDILKRMRDLQEELEMFRSIHEEWIDDHDYGWEDTPTGERAREEQDNLQEWTDDFDNLCYYIEEFLEQ